MDTAFGITSSQKDGQTESLIETNNPENTNQQEPARTDSTQVSNMSQNNTQLIPNENETDYNPGREGDAEQLTDRSRNTYLHRYSVDHTAGTLEQKAKNPQPKERKR